MNPSKTIDAVKMSDLGAEHQWRPNEREHPHVLRLPPEDYLIVVAGTEFGSPASTFPFPNAIAVADRLHEFKHYRANGSKFWTAKAGRDFAFAIPKRNITVLFKEEGFLSYVHVEIGGREYVLNVSGWTDGKGWTDLVRQGASICCGHTIKTLQILNDAALTPEEARAKGIIFPLRPMSDSEKVAWQRIVLQRTVRLSVGDKFALASHCDGGGEAQVYTVTEISPPRKMKLIAEQSPGCPYRIRFSQIDWIDAARRKSVKVPEPLSMTAVPPPPEAEGVSA